MRRIGVFYDGGWFSQVSAYFAEHPPWQARIALGGLHDAIRWHVHTWSGEPIASCVVTESHYVRGRTATPSRAFDTVLEQSGITRHDVAAGPDGREKGVDVYLALETWDRATTAPLDEVVLVTGDADLAPLVTRLHGKGVDVMVPVVDVQFRDPGTGQPAQLRTAGDLRSAATDAPDLVGLLGAALAGGYPLRYPFSSPASGPRPDSRVAPGERRHGTVTRWRPGESFGFITASSDGSSWFASADSLPDGCAELPEGTAVTFSGSPGPAPGRKYPQAYTVRPQTA